MRIDASSCLCLLRSVSVFFFNDTATTEIYTLSLHDALPIFSGSSCWSRSGSSARTCTAPRACVRSCRRSEEHTSELQSRQYLVCRLLLEKKKNGQHRRRRSSKLEEGTRISQKYHQDTDSYAI